MWFFWEVIPGNTSKGKFSRTGGEPPREAVTRQVPPRAAGSQCNPWTSGHHRVRGGKGDSDVGSPASHVHGRSGHQRPEEAPLGRCWLLEAEW